MPTHTAQHCLENYLHYRDLGDTNVAAMWWELWIAAVARESRGAQT